MDSLDTLKVWENPIKTAGALQKVWIKGIQDWELYDNVFQDAEASVAPAESLTPTPCYYRTELLLILIKQLLHCTKILKSKKVCSVECCNNFNK